MNCGIYKIVNLINNKFYIGSSRNIKDRISHHLSELKNNKHTNTHLQNSYNKYGKENFKFEVIEYCELTELLLKEEYYIQNLKPEYNIERVLNTTPIGYKPVSKETREKISIASKNMWKNKTEEELKLASERTKLTLHKRWSKTKEEREIKKHNKYLCGNCKVNYKKSPKSIMCISCRRIFKTRKPTSEETKLKIGTANAGKTPKIARKVEIHGITYANMLNASKSLGVAASTINQRLKNQMSGYFIEPPFTKAHCNNYPTSVIKVL